MKRESLLKHLRRHGCSLEREGRSHSLWINPNTGAVEAIPRHREICEHLARKICRGLSVPVAGKTPDQKNDAARGNGSSSGGKLNKTG